MADLTGQSVRRRRGADVAIVGHGLVGSVLARCLATAGARVVLLDAGCPMSAPPGAHLRNLPACRADRAFYHALVRAHLRPASMPRPRPRPSDPAVPPMPDGNGVNAGQRAGVNLPAARLTNLYGGMGALWNCVAPRLDPELEQWPGIAPQEWDRLYQRAEHLLGVGPQPPAGSPRQDFLLEALAGLSAGTVRPAPVAARCPEPQPPGWTEPQPPHRAEPQPDTPQWIRPSPVPLRWSGPAEILADAGDQAGALIELRPQHAVRRLRHSGGRVSAAEAVALDTGQPTTVEADTFLVATGGIRTPALLWASGVLTDAGEDSPVGRYLCDHPLSYAQVVLDPEVLAGDRDRGDPDPCAVIPVSAQRPFHALLRCDGYDTATVEGRIDDRLVLSLYWYTLAGPCWENRVRFDGRATEPTGLPQPTFEYTLGPDERARQRAALADLRAAGQLLGTFLPVSPPQNLSPGSSMHVMGTTRMGHSPDGHSVVDPYGQVWEFTNLYLGGTGLIPTATATNPTLAACALAIRTAGRIITG